MVNHGEKIKRQQYSIQILTCFLAPKELPASADIPASDCDSNEGPVEDKEGEVSICPRVKYFHSHIFLRRRIYEKKKE